MLKLIKSLVTNRLLHESSSLTVGTIANSFLGLIFYILVARSLSVSSFGYFSFILALGILAADLGDWGIDPSIIKFGGKNLSPILSLGVIQRLLAGVLFLIIAAIASVILSTNFFPAAFVAISLLSLYLVTQSFLAKQKYPFYIATNIFGNSFRLLLVVVAGTLLTAESALLIFAVSNLAAIVLGTTLLVKSFPETKINFRGLRQTILEVKAFSGWSGASFILSAISAKIDNLLVFSLAGPFQAGLYSSAQKIATIFPQVAASLDSVFSPKLALSKTHFKNYLIIASVAAVGTLTLIPFANLILALLGDKYLVAASTFEVLLIGMSIFIFSGPFGATILYHYGKAKVYFINGVLQLTVALISYLILVPRLGSIGAALVFVTTSFVSLVYFVFVYLFFTKHD